LLWNIHVQIVVAHVVRKSYKVPVDVHRVPRKVKVKVQGVLVRVLGHVHLYLEDLGSFKDQEGAVILKLNLVNLAELKNFLMLLAKNIV
tara:strand:- start:166 stop:432 length:267 start_codon:yes stop_codon:yes gene_type:complete